MEMRARADMDWKACGIDDINELGKDMMNILRPILITGKSDEEDMMKAIMELYKKYPKLTEEGKIYICLKICGYIMYKVTKGKLTSGGNSKRNGVEEEWK